MGVYHGRLPREVAAEGCSGSLPWGFTVGGYVTFCDHVQSFEQEVHQGTH